MRLPWFLRGTRQVFLQEFVGNLKSVRFVVMALVSALVIVGAAYGIGSLAGAASGLPPLEVWGHPAFEEDGDHLAVIWVADPFGAPLSDLPVTFLAIPGGGTIGEDRTDGNGFAALNVGNTSAVGVSARRGTFTAGTGISWPPMLVNFTVSSGQSDLDSDGAQDDYALHVLNRTGDPVAGTVLRNGTIAGSLDRFGFILLELPPGESNITVDVAGETFTRFAYVPEGEGLGPTFLAGPDAVLLITSVFSSLIISIFAITISFDAVAKERIHGTLDLLLSRPASRTGVLLGKFFASFAAVAVPITLVNLAGIGAIAAASGKAPTGSFATAFVGCSLLLVAYYVLLQLTLSTLAKTGGTAVLFGVMIWLLLNILYSIVTFVVAAILSAGDPAAQFRIGQYAALGNPSAVVGALISLAAPAAAGFFGGGTALDAPTLGAAAVFWFAFLFILALWVFERRAAA